MSNCIVLGLLRGDQGKGRIVDNISESYDIVARFQGGPNAGHTIYRNGKKVVLHQIPSGILNNKLCLIGHGCIVDISKLINEIEQLLPFIDINIISNNLKIAKGCHVITTKHIEEDTNRENNGKGNGSTKCGISPCYRDKYYREGIRIIDWFNKLENDQNLKDEFINRIITKQQQEIKQGLRYYTNKQNIISYYNLIKNCLIDDIYYMNYIWYNKKILFEGAQGVFLDIDNPYYPNVSSSSVSAGGVITGTGISFKYMKDCQIYGVVKSYMSSVGDGFFPTEIKDSIEFDNINGKKYVFTAEQIREAGQEYGATTGRPRKVGFLDIPMIKNACDTIGVDDICLSRIDTLMTAFPYDKYEYFPICTGYGFKNKNNNIVSTSNAYNWYDVLNEDIIPIYSWVKNWKTIDDQQFRDFIDYLEMKLNTPIRMFTYGTDKNAIKYLNDPEPSIITKYQVGEGIITGCNK